MCSLNNLRRQIEALRQADVEAIDLPATPEQKRQMFIKGLAGAEGLCARAFGPEDQRSNPDYVNGLSLAALIETYRLAMKTIVEKQRDSEELEWFRRLPYQAKIQYIREANVFGIAAADKTWRGRGTTTCGR